MSSLTFATIALAAGTLLLDCRPVIAQPAPAAAKPLPVPLAVRQVERSLEAAKKTVDRLESMKTATAVFAILLIVLTAATGLVQVFNKSWVKTVTAILAVCATATTLVRQQFFPLDYQTCQSAIDEVSPLIDEVRDALEFYSDPNTKEEDRPQTLEALLDRQPSLERFNGIFRGRSGGAPPTGTKSSIAGGSFALYAQTVTPVQFQQQRVIGNAAIMASAEAIASTKSAAYDYAKYLAAERIARQLSTSDATLDAYVLYVIGKGLLRGSACNSAGKEQVRCRIDMSLANNYARSDVVKSLVRAPVAQRSIQGTAPIDPTKQDIVVTTKTKSVGDGQFEFHFVNEKDQLRLWSVFCRSDGGASELWSFDLELTGKKLHIPINLYDSRTTYQIDPKLGRSLPIGRQKAELTIMGATWKDAKEKAY